LTAPDQQTISVVISTYERPDACERALISVLGQTREPLEVLICDDGSGDETAERFRDWQQRCKQVRYLSTGENSGTPACTRNLGIARARGSWVAFLDDDDSWLPDKLEHQQTAITAQTADVIATNAWRSDGRAYFPGAPPLLRPARTDLLKANPLITSSVLVRRSLVRFPTARWLRGVEDYAAWLALADGNARFLVLGEPLVHYEDVSTDRLSTARFRTELAITRLAWQRALRHPRAPGNLTAALRRSAAAAYVAGGELVGVRSRRGRTV